MVGTQMENSNMIFYFRNPVIKPPNTKMRIRVSNFVFPLSFTLVNSSNNLLVINGITYTLTNGNYNSTTFRTHILSLIPASFGLTFNATTLKYTFTNNAAFTLNAQSTCLVLLGFTEQQAYNSVANSLTSNLVVNFSGNNMIYIDIPNINTLNLSSTTGRRTSIIKSIPIPATNGSVMYYEDKTTTYSTIQEDNISFIQVRLLQEDLATPVDFQGQHWQMTLEVAFVYDKEGPDFETIMGIKQLQE